MWMDRKLFFDVIKNAIKEWPWRFIGLLVFLMLGVAVVVYLLVAGR